MNDVGAHGRGQLLAEIERTLVGWRTRLLHTNAPIEIDDVERLLDLAREMKTSDVAE